MDLQKKTLGATERDEEARSAFKERLRGVDPRRLVFVDESSTNVALAPRYARAPKGERAHGNAPRNWGKNVTLISSITLSGMGPSMSIEGSSDTESFGLYVREILAPRLDAGQIVLMDNLSVHRSRWVRELIEERGCQLWLLPSYSPDLKWDEKAQTTLRMEPTMVSAGESQVSGGPTKEGGLRPCPSTTQQPPASISVTATLTCAYWTPKTAR